MGGVEYWTGLLECHAHNIGKIHPGLDRGLRFGHSSMTTISNTVSQMSAGELLQKQRLYSRDRQRVRPRWNMVLIWQYNLVLMCADGLFHLGHYNNYDQLFPISRTHPFCIRPRSSSVSLQCISIPHSSLEVFIIKSSFGMGRQYYQLFSTYRDNE